MSGGIRLPIRSGGVACLLGIVRLSCLVGLLFSGTACVKKDQGGAEIKEKLSPKEQAALDEYKAEVEIGRDMAGRLLTFYGTYGDDNVLGYINQVGNYVASYSDYPERRYMFAVLQSESVNAFACPGGYVLPTLGMLRAVESEAELAAVLGHEVAHVGKKHMFTSLKEMNKKQIEENDKGGEEAAKKSEALKMRRRPKVEETSTGAVLAKYLSGSAGAGINILQAAKAGMNLIMEKGIGPNLEKEADREGVKYAIRAGYDPYAMFDFFERSACGDVKHKRRIKRPYKGKPFRGRDCEGTEATKRLGKTHPSFGDRWKEVQKELEALKARDIIGASGVKRLEKYQKMLPPPDEG